MVVSEKVEASHWPPDQDTRRQHYQDRAFNAYDHLEASQQPSFNGQVGPGGDQQEMICRNPYMLRVTNLPTDLGEEGVRNVFGKYGQVVDCVVRRNWATVSMATHMEAQEAKAALDRGEYGMHIFNVRSSTPCLPLPDTSVPPPNVAPTLKNNADNNNIFEPIGAAVQSQVQAMANDQAPAASAQANKSASMVGAPLVLPRDRPKNCAYCGSPGKLRCSRCKEWYCSQVRSTDVHPR